MSNEKHWSDEFENDEYMIPRLINNTEPLGLCHENVQRVFRAARLAGDTEYFSDSCEWVAIPPCGGIGMSGTYRLRQDFERPEKPKEKKGRWEVCEVYAADCGCWKVRRQRGNSKYLSDAPGMVGYVRNCIEYEEWPGKWLQMGAMKTLYGLADNAPYEDDSGPATPKRVRFWIEE